MATTSARRPRATTDPAKFLPHVSIGYITYDGDPQPIAAALSSLTTRTVAHTFAKADSLELHQDNWRSAAPIAIEGNGQ